MKRKNTGITLIALVITIIVLLILAGVALSLVAGNEGILTKAETAVTETNEEAAKEQAELMVAEISADYYEKRYVDRDATVSGQKIKDYISGQIGATGKLSSNGDYSVKVDGANLTVSDAKGVVVVSGTLEENGKITWDSTPTGGSGEGGSGETPEVAEKYTVTYNANGGTGSVPTDSNEYAEGATVTVDFATIPTKEGYEFLGWAMSADATEAGYTSTGTTSFTMGEANVTLYAVWKQETQTFASQISKDNYGDYVELGTTLLARNEEGVITQKLGGSTPTEQPLTDWRIFHKDSSGGVYLILADYLPYSYETTVGSGLTNGTSYLYNWKSSTSRADLIGRLNGTSNSNAWNKLISSTYTDKGITVTGALDLETWVESWNAKGYTELFTQYTTDTETYNAEGYLVGKTNPPTTGYAGVSNTDTLYFPHTVSLSNNIGYWLASPSAVNTAHVMPVECSGYVRYDGYDSYYFGVRPAVYLPAGISAEKNAEGVWEIK